MDGYQVGTIWGISWWIHSYPYFIFNQPHTLAQTINYGISRVNYRAHFKLDTWLVLVSVASIFILAPREGLTWNLA